MAHDPARPASPRVRLNHAGISALDLDRAVAFYQRWFGFEVVGSFAFDDEPWANAVKKVARARGRATYLRSENAYLEIFEFIEPPPGPGNRSRPVSDAGLTHLGFEVDDLATLQAEMSAAGVEFHSEPQDPSDGSICTYGRDPDGNVFELMQLGGESLAFSLDAPA